MQTTPPLRSYGAAGDAPIPMAKRESMQIRRLDGDRNRATGRDTTVLWLDGREAPADLVSRALVSRYTGCLIDAASLPRMAGTLPKRIAAVLVVADLAELEALAATPAFAELQARGDLVVASADLAALAAASLKGAATCYRAYVDDAASLHGSIELGAAHDYLLIRFRDPTNIPLELVIASLQATHTVLVKEIAPDDLDDAIVTLGVMEVGADGVLYTPRDHGQLDALRARLEASEASPVTIEVGVVVRTAPIGMGYRSCLDLTTLFTPTEGMVVGSTSQGGILCCPEVFFLPYMELRPFRVNAGAVHSYVYNHGDRTDYMTELKAGSPVMIVDQHGKTRRATVGRVKTELRPLRLIEVEFSGGRTVNVIMQDDWHVRVFGADATPRNITELRPGDEVLGHVASPGRHVGIKVDEHIQEA